MPQSDPQLETDGESQPTVWCHLPAIFLAALCGLIFYEAATTLTEQGYASGTPISNAALYPRLLAGLLLVLLVAQVVSDVRARGPSAGGEPAATPDKVGQTGLAALGMFAYVALLPVLGFLLATPLFVLALLLMLGDRNPVTLAGVTLAITAGCLLVFQGLFNVNLPRGLFGIALNF
ncbi:tripartite tricarboxylate transporter TctB family protein [Primorskyibacter sp. 2E233]|uniref:tripartite tricarboxylate transporter TctB family protein n=1 Tax=Primorskyibacter sp. 2E233 TaxID=3413431 RepID=UPI003BF14832